MKKLIALLLVLGFTMPAMADGLGENKDDNVKCEEIFQGSDTKPVVVPTSEDAPDGSTKTTTK